MSNEEISIIIIALVIIAGVILYFSGIFTNQSIFNTNDNSVSVQLNSNTNSTNNNLNPQTNTQTNTETNTNTCGSSVNYPCFKYTEDQIQEKGDGNIEKTEQVRSEPCPVPRPVCKLCYQGLEQNKTEGHLEETVQEKLAC